MLRLLPIEFLGTDSAIGSSKLIAEFVNDPIKIAFQKAERFYTVRIFNQLYIVSRSPLDIFPQLILSQGSNEVYTQQKISLLSRNMASTCLVNVPDPTTSSQYS